MLLLTIAVELGAYALASPPPVVVLIEYSLCWCCPFLYAVLSALASVKVVSAAPSVAVVLMVIIVDDPGAALSLASILMLLAVYGYVSSDSCMSVWYDVVRS